MQNLEELLSSLVSKDERAIVNSLKGKSDILALRFVDGSDPLEKFDDSIVYCMILTARLAQSQSNHLKAYLNPAHHWAKNFKKPSSSQGAEAIAQFATTLLNVLGRLKGVAKMGGIITMILVLLAKRLGEIPEGSSLTLVHPLALIACLEVGWDS